MTTTKNIKKTRNIGATSAEMLLENQENPDNNSN